MRNTENLNLALYDASDKMNITGAENSLNHNMELLDAELAKKMSAPYSGATGQVLTKMEDGFAWQDAPTKDAVLYTTQELSEEQRIQARENIAAADAYSTAKISEDVDTLMGVLVTERMVKKKYSFDVVVGKSIYADKYSFDGLSIASGKAYTVLFSSDSASFTNIQVYEKYDDGTHKSYSVNFNTEKQAYAQGNIVAFAIFLDSNNIMQGGTTDFRVTYASTNEDSFQYRLSKLEKGMQGATSAISDSYSFTAKLANQVTSSAKEFHVLVDDRAASYKKGDCLLIDVEITASEKINWLDHRFTWDDGTMWKLGYPSNDYGNPNQRASFTCTMVLDKDRTLNKISNYCSPVADNTEAAAYEVTYTIEKVYSREEEILLPDYYHADGYIEGKADAINECLDACAANGDAFFFLTDIHWEQNVKRSPAILHYLRQHTGIDTILNGGDNYYGRPSTGTRDVTLALRRAVGDRVYLADGNHEFADFVKDGLTYSAKYAANNMHTRDAVYGTDAHTYYYVDRPDNRMRYVFLQAFGYDESASETSGGYTQPMRDDAAQLEWFTNTALNVGAGWTIVIIAHCFYTFDGSGNAVLMTGAEGYVNAINSYSGAGTIACVLSGHTHRDAILYLGADGSGVPNILTTCDKFMKASDDDMPNGITREPHTVSEQAIDAVIIDKTNRSIKIVRIGGQAGAWSGTADAGTRVEMREASY